MEPIEKRGFFSPMLKLVQSATSSKIAAALIISGIIITAGVLLTVKLQFSGKSPREFYLEAEGKNFKIYADQIKKGYKDFYEAKKPYMEGVYKSRYELTAGITTENNKLFGLPNAKSVFDIIRKCKLVIDANVNPAGKETLTRLALLLESAPLVDAEIFTKDRQLTFTVPVLLPDKYMKLDIDKIDDVYKRFNIPVRPKRIPTAVEIAKTIKFSDEEFDAVANEYGVFIASFITDDEVKYGKNAVVKIGGADKEGREVIVTLGSDKIKKLFDGITDKMSRDEVLLKLTYGNFTGVVEIYDDAGLFQLFKLVDKSGLLKLDNSVKNVLNSLSIEKNIEQFKKGISEFGKNGAWPDGLEMTLVIDSTGNILERKVATAYSGTDGIKHAITIQTGTNDSENDDFSNGICDITLESENAAGEKITQECRIDMNILPLPKNDDEKGKVHIFYVGKKNDVRELELDVKLNIDRHTDEKEQKKYSVTEYDIRFGNGKTGGKLGALEGFDGKIDTVSWKNNKKRATNTNTVFTVNADLPSLNIKNTTLTLDLKKEDRLGVEFSLPDISGAEIIDLNNISDSGFAAVKDEIFRAFGEFYVQNQPLVDALTGK